MVKFKAQRGRARLVGRRSAPAVGDQDGARVVAGLGGTFDVVRGEMVLASGFSTNAAAWAWLDRHSEEGLADVDRNCRIRASAAFS